VQVGAGGAARAASVAADSAATTTTVRAAGGCGGGAALQSGAGGVARGAGDGGELGEQVADGAVASAVRISQLLRQLRDATEALPMQPVRACVRRGRRGGGRGAGGGGGRGAGGGGGAARGESGCVGGVEVDEIGAALQLAGETSTRPRLLCSSLALLCSSRVRCSSWGGR
jgi:hypothetical protein